MLYVKRKNWTVFIMSKVIREKKKITTYKTGQAESLPLFFEKRPYQGASGKVYPIPYVPKIEDDKIDKEYEEIILENKYIRVELLPEIGGKINRAFDKFSNYDFIYYNKVIKPAMVGLAGPWVSGGIEFNWPQHHRPTTFMKVDVTTGQNERESWAYLGEIDYFYNMKAMAKICVDDEHSYITAEITVYNCTPEAHPFMWWANMAVEVNENYRIVFPPDVEYVNDHDRRAVLEWPIAKGVYQTARPYDYQNGTDIHCYPNIIVPSSFMVAKGQSEGDFLGGYDVSKKCGVIACSEHHISPGKKLWTWGENEFGKKWCSNLTDDGSKYVELMTGVYTDNQPDFTWIAPYETKTFEQYWYPVSDIGEAKSANKEGACNLVQTAKGYYVAVHSTSVRKNCLIKLESNGKIIWNTRADIMPEQPFLEEVSVVEKSNVKLTAIDEAGNIFVEYKEYVRGRKKPITPRKPALPPEKITNLEELYLNGIHLVQYKHFAYRAQDYFLEGLRRDPFDSRCNKAMGDDCLHKGDFVSAEKYYTAAIKRLTLRNDNPYDTEPFYGRALCRFYKGDLNGAYDDAYQSIWSYPQRSAGYYLLAKISALRGKYPMAEEFLKVALETNSQHLWARYILGLISGEEDVENKIKKIDPLFFAGLETQKNAIFFALEYMQFGLLLKAKTVLENCNDGAIKYYYLAYIAKLQGEKDKESRYKAKADSLPWQCEFPSKKESLVILNSADTPMSHYYAGCILYHFERYEAACAEWEKTVKKTDFAPAYRNLALGYFDHLDKKDKARNCLEKAFSLYPSSDRIFYELTQLYKNLNLPLKERLLFFENNRELMEQRDDCVLQYSQLLTINDEYEKARETLLNHRFHTYEGGEGNLTGHHAWLQFLIGLKLFLAKKYDEAFAEFERGLTFPENYGEEKTYFVNDAPLFYGMAKCKESNNCFDEAEQYYKQAQVSFGNPSVNSYYQVKALRRSGKMEQAEKLIKEMYKTGKEKIINSKENDYFGVGAFTYPPFSYDVERVRRVSGNLLCAYACLLKDETKSADRHIKNAAEIDCANFYVYLFHIITRSEKYIEENLS